MKHLRIVIPMVALAALGLAFVATNRGAQAAHPYDLYINPGGSTNLLTCGWHEACTSTPVIGTALDWGNTSGQTVYWRSFGMTTSGLGVAGSASTRVADGVCYNFSVDIRSAYGASLGTEAYTHSQLSLTTPFTINAGSPPSGTMTVTSLGTTRSNELADCKNQGYWTGPHLHQYSTNAPGWSRNSGLYPNAPAGGVGYPLNAIGSWQNRRTWTE